MATFSMKIISVCVLFIYAEVVNGQYGNSNRVRRQRQASETGICSFCGAVGEIPPGHPTASGQGFDRLAMKTAHKTLPFGTKVRITNVENGKTVDAEVNDRGPFTAGRILDLTYGAFGRIANHDKGIVKCSYKVIG